MWPARVTTPNAPSRRALHTPRISRTKIYCLPMAFDPGAQSAASAVPEWSTRFFWRVAPCFIDDQLIIGEADGTLSLYEPSAGGLSAAYAPVPAGLSPLTSISAPGGDASPVAGDLNGDGLPDLLVGSAAGVVDVFVNTGTPGLPQFGSALSPDVTGLPTTASNVTGAATPALTDVDGDGDLDLLVGGLDGSLRCFLNNGTGAFSGCSASALLSGTGPVAVSGRSAPAVGDLDGDGGADLVVGGANGAIFHLVNTGSTSAPLWAYNGTLAAVEGPSAPAVRPAAAGGPAHVFVGGGDGSLAAYTAGGMAVSPDTYRLSALRGDAYGGVALRYTTTEPPGALSAHAVRRRTALALQPLLPVQHTVELWSIAASATSAGATELTLTIRASLGASEAALLASASTVACALEGATAATGPAESDAALAEMRQMAAKPIALSQLLHGGSARPIACDPTKIISPPPLPSPPPPAPAELPPPSFPPPPPNLPVAELWGRDDGATQSVMLQGGLATVSVPVTLISLCAFLRLCLGGMRSLARRRLLERRKKRNQKFARGGGKDGGARAREIALPRYFEMNSGVIYYRRSAAVRDFSRELQRRQTSGDQHFFHLFGTAKGLLGKTSALRTLQLPPEYNLRMRGGDAPRLLTGPVRVLHGKSQAFPHVTCASLNRDVGFRLWSSSGGLVPVDVPAGAGGAAAPIG